MLPLSIKRALLFLLRPVGKLLRLPLISQAIKSLAVAMNTTTSYLSSVAPTGFYDTGTRTAQFEVLAEAEEGQANGAGTPAAPEPPALPMSNTCEDNWTWNPKDHSHEVVLHGPKNRIARFHPNWSNGTAGVRGTRRLDNQRFYWEINVSQRIFGTSMMFGVGTKSARLHADTFVNMLGEDQHSWGLSHKGFLWHGGRHRLYTKAFRENVATTIGLLYDGTAGTLTYYKDGISLGVAFEDIWPGDADVTDDDDKCGLYPIVCSTAAKTEMALGITRRDFFSLQDRCRTQVLRQLTREAQVHELPLPKPIKRFIMEGFDDFQVDRELAQNNSNSNAVLQPSLVDVYTQSAHYAQLMSRPKRVSAQDVEKRC